MRRPPDGMDMRGSLRGSGRGGVITQEELKRRIEHQQKQNEINMGQQQLIGSQQSQLMAMNQNQNLLKAKIYEQNHLRQGSTLKIIIGCFQTFKGELLIFFWVLKMLMRSSCWTVQHQN